MNKEKIKNLVIIVESALLGLVALTLCVGGIKSCSSDESKNSSSNETSLNKNTKKNKSNFKNLSDEDAYNTYFKPCLTDDYNCAYALEGQGYTNVLDTSMDFSFEASDIQFRYYDSVESTTARFVIKRGLSWRVYYHDVSYTYGVVTAEFSDGTSYDCYLKSLTDSNYRNYLPLIYFLSEPTPSDYSDFNNYFYSYWSTSVGSQYKCETTHIKPWSKIPWLNLKPSTNEFFIVGMQGNSSYLRVAANLSNLTCWGYSTDYYEGSSDAIFLGDLFFDYDGDLCIMPSNATFGIYFWSSAYMVDWWKENTFTRDEWNNGLYYLSGDMNLVTKYLYEDISNFSGESGNVTSLDDLRFKIYKTNLTSTTTLLSEVNLVKSVLASGDTKYTLRVVGDDSRATWADNTDAGDYVIAYDDGGTALNFKYGLSTRIVWDDCVVTCQDTYTICKYFAPYYATALIDGDVTTDGSSLTSSAFSNVFVMLGTAFTLCFGWLNVEVFPGITIFGLLLVPFVVVLIIVVFRLVKK